jgi:N-sulfoglucosamine sulfohydrolase
MSYRRSILLILAVGLAGIAAAGASAPAAQPRPNILWITAEDINAHLGCYGDPVARTPNLDRLARQGVRYTHAFAVGPVCSPSRSCLITGLYATSLGTAPLRCRTPIPPEIRAYAAYLRDAGYYTTNNSKTDYNLQNEPAFIRDAWDRCDAKAHWRGRRPGQPFFSVFNLMTSHQSRTSVWPFAQFEKEVGSRLRPEERIDPARVKLPPYYPDTSLARRTLARYYDCISVMDKEAGQLLAQLEADGLAEETIVFFYGDNGAGLPRHKRLPHDSGMRVPLVIRFPKKFQHLATDLPGQVTDRLVSFVDFAPSVLSLCGVPVPTHIQGEPFLGPKAAKPRQFVYGARDRVDEAFDLSRMVRDRRWLYVRNYMPHISWAQPEGYSDQSEFRREITRLAAEGKLNATQMTYAGPTKPLEELYDSDDDPHQVHNLAADPRYSAVLERMRQLHRRWLLETRDLSFATEEQWAVRAGKAPPFQFRDRPEKYPLERILAAADLVGRPTALAQQVQLLRDRESAVRYWAAVGLRAAGQGAASARDALVEALGDDSPSVRIEAAAALASLDREPNPQCLKVLTAALQSDQPDTAVRAARQLQLLGEKSRPVWPEMRKVLERAKTGTDDTSLYLRFTLGAALGEPAVLQ